MAGLWLPALWLWATGLCASSSPWQHTKQQMLTSGAPQVSTQVCMALDKGHKSLGPWLQALGPTFEAVWTSVLWKKWPKEDWLV